MSLSKFAIAGVLAAGLGLATATPADAQVIYSRGGYYPGGTFYVRPTPYVYPSYGYGYRSFYPSYGYGYGYRPWGYPYRAGIAWQASLPTRTEREVALLIRDGTSGKPLFEARASSDDGGNEAVLRAAMFEAAMQDFPKLGLNPRRVVVPLSPAP